MEGRHKLTRGSGGEGGGGGSVPSGPPEGRGGGSCTNIEKNFEKFFFRTKAKKPKKFSSAPSAPMKFFGVPSGPPGGRGGGGSVPSGPPEGGGGPVAALP